MHGRREHAAGAWGRCYIAPAVRTPLLLHELAPGMQRPALAALAFLSALVGSVAMARGVEHIWTADIQRNLDAARALVNGDFGTTPDYLYSPLAAALTVPALAVPTDVAVVAWLLFKVGLLAAGAAFATRGLDRVDRILVGIAVVAFLPLLYDLEVGNVTVLVLVSVALIAWTPDRIATGIPLGLILATAPKPQLLPILIWMLLVHRRALIGALVTAGFATLVGLAVIGSAAYATWVAILRAPAYLNAGEILNLAIWGLPAVVAVPAAVAAIAAFAVALRRGYWPGLVAAICVGILLAPYTLIYAAGVVPAVAPAMARAATRTTLVLALVAPAVLVVAFPVWIAAVLALAVLLPATAWPPPPRSDRAVSVRGEG